MDIYTDGGCWPNPGPGGYGYVICSEPKITGYGFKGYTTNNEMELTAAIQALVSLPKEHDDVVIYSDSQYVVKGMSLWIKNWKKSDWKSGTLQNLELWQDLDSLSINHKATFKWVRGHDGNLLNEEADALATKGKLEIIEILK